MAVEKSFIAIQLKPDDADAWFNRGVAFNNTSDHAMACKDWREAAKYSHKEAIAYLIKYCK